MPASGGNRSGIANDSRTRFDCLTPNHGMPQEIIDEIVFAARSFYPKPEPHLRLIKGSSRLTTRKTPKSEVH